VFCEYAVTPIIELSQSSNDFWRKVVIHLQTASRNRQGMSRELISEPGSAAVCGIRSHNGFTIYYPGFKFSVHTGHEARR
jgi:hypothetical protein